MVLGLLLLRQAIVLIGTLAGGYTDAKTGLILDRITYPMIALGILLSLVEGQWLFLGIGAFVRPPAQRASDSERFLVSDFGF